MPQNKMIPTNENKEGGERGTLRDENGMDSRDKSQSMEGDLRGPWMGERGEKGNDSRKKGVCG